MQPERRCSVVATKGKQFLLLSVVERPKVEDELEPLMFFDSTPMTFTPSTSIKEQVSWSKDTKRKCVILEVSRNGDLVVSPWFSSSSFRNFSEAYCGLDLHQTDSVMEFPVAFGCLLLDKLYVLVAKEVEVGATLPCGGTIWRVTQTQWVPLELPGGDLLGMTSSDRSRLQEFQDYSHTSGYYYSEDANLELPFPFTKREDSVFPNLHCNWSEEIRKSILQCGVPGYNISLIRGFVGERVLTTKEGATLHLVLLGRQNKCNPGPRYYGRGLNNEAAAGNEHFYEYVLWKNANGSVAYVKHVFFRGTVPLYWSTEGIESQMVFNPKTVYGGTDTYFTRLFRTAKENMELESPSVEVDPRIRCLNLLKQDIQQQESILSAYFIEGVQRSIEALSHSFTRAYLDICSFDWLSFSKTFGTEAAVEELWRKTVPFLAESSGRHDSPMSLGLIDSSGVVERLISQSRFLRVNCADSLDRTNLGCFFVCLQCTVAMLSVLQIHSNAFQIEPEIPFLESRESSSKYLPPPTGGGRPTIPSPYVETWGDVMQGKKLAPGVVRALAQLFTDNGDCVARLYTSSAAMHGNLLRTISGTKASTANALIATQRFFENTFEDKKKNRNLQLLLGKNRTTYFSCNCWVFFTLPLPRKQWPQAVVASGIILGTTHENLLTPIKEVLKTCIDPSAIIRIALQSEDSPPDKTENDGPRVAVILLKSRTASSILIQKQHILVKGAICTLAPYHYDIEYSDERPENKGMKAALKDGFRQLVRGIS